MQFVKCTGFDYCADEKTIDEYLRNKFLIFMYNEKFFDPSFLGEKSIIKQAKFDYIPVNTQFQ